MYKAVRGAYISVERTTPRVAKKRTKVERGRGGHTFGSVGFFLHVNWYREALTT